MKFTPLKGLAAWTIGLSIAMVVCMTIVSVAEWIGYLSLPGWLDPDTAVDGPLGWSLIAIQLLFGLAGIGLWLGSAVVFFIWFAYANGNVPALGVGGKKVGAGWSVGWWFVPFANLFMPFRALKETYIGSQPDVWVIEVTEEETPSIVGWWWGLWLAANAVSQIETRMMFSGTEGAVTTALYLGLLTITLTIISLVLFVRWCTEITRSQEVKSKHSASPELAMGDSFSG